MQTLAVASKNAGKLAEIKAIFGTIFEIKSMAEFGLSPDIAETGATFEENAVIKAMELYRLLGVPSLSDDSGLCVDYLDGRPGVFSARFSVEGTDEANNALLLKQMQGAEGAEARRARFVSAVALVSSKTEIFVARGEVEGFILNSARGQGGFGYDPLFFCNELSKTFGEASSEEKNSVSHRARALFNLQQMLLR